jgi:hypothetical protein
MINRYISTGMAIALGVAITPISAVASTLDWSYTYDSTNDGYSSGVIGSNSAYELYYAAFSADRDRLYFAFNSNMPYGGVPATGALGNHVSWGDLFLNFSGQPFATTNTANHLYGIRFIPSNDSGVSQLGLYSSVTAQSVTSDNLGFDSLMSYRTSVVAAGGTPSLGALPIDTNYFDQSGEVLNVIKTGTRIADVDLLTDEQLSRLAPGNGRYTYGVSVDRSILPTGDFIASLFAECANDSIALIATNAPSEPVDERVDDGTGTVGEDIAEIPEPSAVLSMLLVGGLIARRARQRTASS